MGSEPSINWQRLNSATIIVGGVLAIALLSFGAWTSLSSHDTFGYLAMGRDFLESGKSLFVDHLSITHQGQRLKPNPWLYSLLSGLANSALGLNGLFIFFNLLWIIPPSLIAIWAYRRKLHGYATFVALLFLTSAFLMRVQLRPELVAYTFLILALFLAHRFTLDGRPKWILAMGAVFVLWTQFHSTSSMMLPLFGAAWLHRLLVELHATRAEYRVRLLLRFGGWGVGFLALGFVNPNGLDYHPFALANVHLNEWRGVITEYSGDQSFTTVVQWINLVAGATLFLLLLNRGDLSKCSMLAVKIFYGLEIPKLAPHVSVSLITIGLLSLEGHVNRSRRAPSVWALLPTKNDRLIPFVARPVYLLVILTLVLGGVAIQFSRQFPALATNSLAFGAPPINELEFAVDVAEFMKNRGIAGPTISEMGTASYLSYAVGQPIQLYVDQRVGILIPKVVFDSYRESIIREKHLLKLTSEHGIVALVGSRRWPERLLDTGLRTRLFSIGYIGKNFSLLVPTASGNGYNEISWLIHDPACLKQIDQKKLSDEIDRLKREDSDSSRALLDIANTAISLLNQKRSDSIKIEDLKSDSRLMRNPVVVRLLSYWLRESGDYRSALGLRDRLGEPPKLIDFFETALALSAIGDHTNALGILFSAGPQYYFGSRQKAAQFLFIVEGILGKAGDNTPLPDWMAGLRSALQNDPEDKNFFLGQRSCRPTK